MNFKKLLIVNILISIIFLSIIIFLLEFEKEKQKTELLNAQESQFKDGHPAYAYYYNLDEVDLNNIIPFTEISDNYKSKLYNTDKSKYFLESKSIFAKATYLLNSSENSFVTESYICNIIDLPINPSSINYYNRYNIEEDIKEWLKTGMLVNNGIPLNFDKISDSDLALKDLTKPLYLTQKYYRFKTEIMETEYNSMIRPGQKIDGNYNRLQTFLNIGNFGFHYIVKVEKYSPELIWENYLKDLAKYFAMALTIQFLINILLKVIKKH